MRRVEKTAKTRSDVNKAQRQGNESVKRDNAGQNNARQNTDHQRIAKIDRENEVAPPPKVPPTVGKAMKEARMEKDLSQKELAQKANQKPSVIQDIESGKAITDHNILMKLERILGVKLRGADIGKKFDDTGKKGSDKKTKPA